MRQTCTRSFCLLHLNHQNYHRKCQTPPKFGSVVLFGYFQAQTIVNMLLWKGQPTQANRKLATISTYDPVDPTLPATACVRTSFPQASTVQSKFHSGTLPPSVPQKSIIVVFVLLRCRRRNAEVPPSTLHSVRVRLAVSDVVAHLRGQAWTAVASFREKWFAQKPTAFGHAHSMFSAFLHDF